MTRLERTRDDVLEDLNQLPFSNLSFDIHSGATIDIALRRHHLSLTPLVLADDPRLVWNDNLSVHHDREINVKDFTKNPRMGCVRWIL